MLTMTSIGCNEIKYDYMPKFKRSCHLYRKIGSLIPNNNSNLQFPQIYFLGDHNIEASIRCNYEKLVDEKLMIELQQVCTIYK